MEVAKPHGTRYPWDEWFSKREFTVYQGVDYAVQSWSMREMIRKEAKKRGVRTTIVFTEQDACLDVVVHHPPPPKKRRGK